MNKVWIVTARLRDSQVETFEGVFAHIALVEQSVRMTYSNTPAVIKLREGQNIFEYFYDVTLKDRVVATFIAREKEVLDIVEHF